MTAGNLGAWDVDPSGIPLSGTAIDKARFAVRYAVLAPSSHNTQPWRFIVNGDELLVCADRTRSLANIDPFQRSSICGLRSLISGCQLTSPLSRKVLTQISSRALFFQRRDQRLRTSLSFLMQLPNARPTAVHLAGKTCQPLLSSASSRPPHRKALMRRSLRNCCNASAWQH
jgi:hypothetical protein